MQIIGLDHVQLAMPPGGEVEACHFYGEVLGLVEVEKPAPLAAKGGCWFAGPGTAVHLGVQADFVPARKAHPAFRVADLQACRQDLAAAGVTATPDTSIPGVRRLYAFDPFGNRLEFIQDGDSFTGYKQNEKTERHREGVKDEYRLQRTTAQLSGQPGSGTAGRDAGHGGLR